MQRKALNSFKGPIYFLRSLIIIVLLAFLDHMQDLLVGDFLANHAKFCVNIIHKFAKAFEFYDMNLDTAL